MEAEAVAAWLDLIGYPPKGSRPGWVTAQCPLAPIRHQRGTDSNPSFGVRIGPGQSHTHCFSCGWSGSQTDLLLEMRFHKIPWPVEALGVVEEADKNQALSLSVRAGDDAEVDEYAWPDWFLDAFAPALDYEQAAQYLRERGVLDEVVERMDIRWDVYRSRVCFPIRDVRGRLRAMQGRTIIGDRVKYLSYTCEGQSGASIVLGESWADYERPLVLVEGPIDAARVAGAYPNVVALLGASVTLPRLRRVRLAQDVVTMFDADKAGAGARALVSRFFGRDARVRHVILSDGDPGDLSDDDLQSLARQLRSNNLLGAVE